MGCSMHRLVHDLYQASTAHHQCYVARAVLLASKEKLMRDQRNKCLLCTAKVCLCVHMYVNYVYIQSTTIFFICTCNRAEQSL